MLVAGLEYWSPGGEQIVESRLTEKLCHLLSVPTLQLRTPPPDQEDPAAPPTGVTAWQFPEWFVTQDVNAGDDGPSSRRSRMLVHRRELARGNKFIDEYGLTNEEPVATCPKFSCFVSSANFTEAAHSRNIEIGVLIDSNATASRISDFFASLVGQRLLVPIY